MTPPRAEARVAGQSVPVAEALDRAAELLARARSPFVHGLAASPVGTARLAARLAARAGAAIDVEGGELLAPEIEAIAATGQVTATFGEIRAAADCVVLWRVERSDPAIKGLPQETRNGPRRVIPMQIPEGRDLATLQALRSLLNGATASAEPRSAPEPRPAPEFHSGPESPDGLPHAALQEAAAAILQARQVAVLWDAASAACGPGGGGFARALAAGFALLTLDPRRRPRIAARAVGVPGHVAGAMSGLLAATGFPRAVAFRGGEPRCDPERFGAARMLSGGADLVLAIGPLGSSPRPAKVPILLMASRLPEGWPEPEVFLPVASPSAGGGSWLAADGVPDDHAHAHAQAQAHDATGDGTRLGEAGAAAPAGSGLTEAEALTALIERLA